MAAPPTLDFEALLTPIAGENPAGESLRYVGPYDAIQEARRADDDLSQGDWVRDTKTADWPAVIEIAREALATRSKDLQIAVWLVEAMVKQYGFPGLRDGLRLVRELLEQFWDSLYPEIEDEEDLDFRAAPLEWLNEKLPPTIRQIPVTQGTSGEAYSWMRWDESRTIDNLGRRDREAMQAALADGKISGEQFDKAMETTPLAYYRSLFEELNQVQELYDELVQLVDEKFGREAPSLLVLKKGIEDCYTLVEDILRKRGGLEREPLPQVLDSEGQSVLPQTEHARIAHTPSPQGLSLAPQDRADALRRLDAVADYFRRTEPHSPVSYLVQRAVRWAEMSLEDWLRYIIHDDTVLESVRETLGLKDSDLRGPEEDRD